MFKLKRLVSLIRQGGWIAFKSSGRRFVSVVISATQTSSVNLFTLAGSPKETCDVLVTVNSGVDCQQGVILGTGWVSGCTIKIVNAGNFYGTGGQAGFGGSVTQSVQTTGQDGFGGGDALTLGGFTSITIDNTAGWMYGGGGGGGGGGADCASNPPLDNAQAAGGGGGGGRGFNVTGGAKGTTYNAFGDASDGTTGTSSAAGTGGARGSDSRFNAYAGGNGGNGGDWATVGSAGQAAVGFGGPHIKSAPGNGGSAGFAVRTNGTTITWIGGSDSRVTGSIG